VMQSTTRMKRPFSLGRIRKIDSTLVHVEGIITEMRHDADSSGQHYRHTAALKRARTLLEPPIALSTYYRYWALFSKYHLGEVRYWLGSLDLYLAGRSSKNGAQA
jgi:hypothetical protein